MSKNTVYPDGDEDTLGQIGANLRQELDALGEFRCHADRPADDAEYLNRVKEANAILLGWDLPAAVMEAVPNLEIVSFTGTGVERFVDLDLARQRGITVCNCTGYGDVSVAEHALALTFALARKLIANDRLLRQGRWAEGIGGAELNGRICGVVGFGGIGQAFARMATALGMRVLAWTRNPGRYREAHPEVEFVELEHLFQKADVISLHLAHRPETESLVGGHLFDLVKPDAMLINTARGEVLDEAALIDALQAGRLAGAALDVFATEPLPNDHPLCDADNTILTPHVGFDTPDAARRVHEIAARNILAYFGGKPVNVVVGSD